jgi:uncharacterized membrane protein
MKPEDMNTAIVIAWAFVWSVIAVAIVNSVSSWTLLVGAAALSALMVLRTWQPPVQTVPVSVRKLYRRASTFV